MKSLKYGLQLIFSRKDSILVFLISSFLFLFIIFYIQNGENTRALLSFDSLPFKQKFLLSFSSFFNLTKGITSHGIILIILSSLLSGINISLAYTYIKIRGEIILKSGIYSGIGLIFAFLGIGCVACGTAYLAIILNFFGLGSILTLLPYNGEEIGYAGLLILAVATYMLSKKVHEGNVC